MYEDKLKRNEVNFMAVHDIEQVRVKTKAYPTKYNLTNTDADMIHSVEHIGQTMDNHLKSSIIEKSGNWISYKEKWLSNEEGTLPTDFYNYSRGDIILAIDLGTVNMGTEIRYPHPCVVLYDNREDWVIVAPITAAQRNKQTGEVIVHEPFEVFIDAQRRAPVDRNEFYFKKKSVVQVDQICRLSKSRAINKTTRKLRTDILNQIDNVILSKYVPKKNDLLERLKEQLNTTDKLNRELVANVEALENEKSELKLEIERLKKEIEK